LFQDLYLHTGKTRTKPTQTFMILVGFEPTIQAFEMTKTVRALEGGATVIGTRKH
jgi:hypothetical protein